MCYKNNIDSMLDKPNDECGIYGIYSRHSSNLASTVYFGIYALQHRGQESAGIAVTNGNEIEYYKNIGLANEVFNDSILQNLPEGDLALGHVRYTKENNNVVNAQPIVYNGKFGMFAIAMNGKITNAKKLRVKLIEEGVAFQSNLDVEVIANLINQNYNVKNIKVGLKNAVEQLEGSFAIAIITSKELIAIRDRFGLRPMVVGESLDDFYIASESCAFDATGVDFIRDIMPGEILIINKNISRDKILQNNNNNHSIYLDNSGYASCIFEHVYLARADSIIDGKSVYKARYNCGENLAKKIIIDADLVAGVPDSAVVAARGYSAQSGIPYIDVLEKNRYVGRTFIQPNQMMRENSVRIKLNAHRANIEGKKIILIDDSIVRGTTSKKIVDLLKRLGAKEVHMIIASPIVKHPCYTGIDIESYDQLIGAKRSAEEISKIIGTKSLHFMQVEDLIECCKSKVCSGFCTGCFSGNYPDNIDIKIK